MIQVFKTDEEYVKWLDGQRLPSGIVVYVSEDETMYFTTNNIKGELKTYKCEKDEVIQYPPLVYSAKSAGSTITVNGQSMTLEQGDNITLDYPNEITSVEATNNTELTAIQIPNTVVSINDNAFTGCTALTDFNYNGTVEQWGAITLGTDWKNNAAFTVVHCTDGDVSLEEPIIYPPLVYSTNAAGSTITVNGETVTLGQGENIVLDYPNEITSVEATSNTALTYMQIPNTVTSISNDAFNGCNKLASINIPESVKSIGQGAFYNCTSLGSVTLPEGITTINNITFYGCSSLVSVNIPNTVTKIEDGGYKQGAFYNCTSLASVTLPDSLTSIGSFAFMGCNKLVSINIPESVKSIGDSVFYGCSSLVSVTLPNTMTMMGRAIFKNCTSLASVTLPDTITNFDSVSIFEGCSSLVSVTLPDTMISIGIGAIIGSAAFMNCTELVSINIPESVKSIEGSAFNGCNKLASITIPSGVKSINYRAFYNCSKLTDFNFNGTKAQWASIKKGDEWNYNSAFLVVHCTNGDVTL